MSDAALMLADAPVELSPDPSAVRIWGTKGISFWALLSAILIKARPTSLLELGSGRSTTFLADYAFRNRAQFVSIEQSEIWHRKAVADLQFMKVKGAHVHHVPISQPDGEPPWYDVDEVNRLVGKHAFDFVLVDGPVGDARRSPSGKALIARAARRARLVMVDDVHRHYNDVAFKSLAKRFPRDGIFYYRYGGNLIAMAAAEEWREIVRSAFDFLELDYTAAAPPDPAR